MGIIRYVAEERHGADLTGLTELRVHGVGGTTPEELLDEPHPRQVAGDRIAGFFRRDDVEGRHVEAYSWGGLTSRSGVRVLWLLLLPFTLANLAGWMYRPDSGGRPPRGHRGLLRLLGFALTLVYVLWLCSIAMDLIAYQCGGQAACVSDRWWLTPLTGTAIAGYPARRLLVGALLPLAVIGGLGYLARSTRSRYEQVSPDGTSRDADAVAAQERSYTDGLASPGFWFGEPLVRRLSRLHLAGAMALVAYTLTRSTHALELGSPQALAAGSVLRWTGLAVLAATTLAVCVPARLPDQAVRALSGAAAILLAGAALFAATRPAAGAGGTPGPLPGWREVAVVVFALQLLGLIALGLLVAWQALTRGRPEAGSLHGGFRWGGPLVASTLAALTLDAFFAGTAVRLAGLHARPVATGTDWEPNAGVIVYPQVYDLFAVAFVVVLVVVATVCAVAWRRRWAGTWKPRLNEIRAEYADDLPPSAAAYPQWVTRIARVRCLSESVDRADLVLTGTAVIAILLAAADLAVRTGLVTSGPTEQIVALSSGSWSWVWTASTWIVSTIPLVAVAVMRYAYGNPQLRRKVSIIWDVGTFWPRAYHPLAPPCYAERAVLDLRSRMRRILEHGGRVLVSAHSQGTVLATAALLALPAHLRRNIGFVTYGCPLGRLYQRFFPACFGAGTLTDLGRSLAAAGGPPRWQNFWRDTDLIGGPVLSATGTPAIRETFLRDPATSSFVETDPFPPVSGHSGYLEDPQMAARVRELAAHLLGEAGRGESGGISEAAIPAT